MRNRPTLPREVRCRAEIRALQPRLAAVFEDLVRDPARQFPKLDNRDAVTALRVWFCKYRSLSQVADFSNLETLVIAGYPGADFAPLAGLTGLRYLRILDFPKVRDLSPLAELPRLQTLRLATPPYWDSAGRALEVQSLAPLALIPELQHVELFGVRPPDQSLAPLETARALMTLRVSKYPKDEVARYRAETGQSDAFAPAPGIAGWD